MREIRVLGAEKRKFSSSIREKGSWGPSTVKAPGAHQVGSYSPTGRLGYPREFCEKEGDWSAVQAWHPELCGLWVLVGAAQSHCLPLFLSCPQCTVPEPNLRALHPPATLETVGQAECQEGHHTPSLSWTLSLSFGDLNQSLSPPPAPRGPLLSTRPEPRQPRKETDLGQGQE